MNEAMQYIHIFVPNLRDIDTHLDSALRSYREQQNAGPDWIELGDAEIQAVSKGRGPIPATASGPSWEPLGPDELIKVWREPYHEAVPIRHVESPHYFAVVGEHLTVLVHEGLWGRRR